MRDSDLVVKAQRAASALEGAWHRWRVAHGDRADPMPAVSSYVGYSLQEPLGQPRVVFGIAAEDAEQLAALIERHDCGTRAYVAAVAQPSVAAPMPAPVPLATATARVDLPIADVLLAGENPGYDEPVYRQAAAAMKEAAAARENARGGSISADQADLVSPEWTGALAKAASTARAEAEARIRATLTELDHEPAGPADASEPDDAAGADADARDAVVDNVQADGGPAAAPQIYATDVLEPLPKPEGATRDDAPGAEEPPDASRQDGCGQRDRDEEHEDEDALDRDARDEDPSDEDVSDEDVSDEGLSDEGPSDEDVSDDVSEPDDHEVVASVQTGGPGTGIARRGRANRGYQAARMSKTKRPGASSQPAGG